jgi:hypothetical protein
MERDSKIAISKDTFINRKKIQQEEKDSYVVIIKKIAKHGK